MTHKLKFNACVAEALKPIKFKYSSSKGEEKKIISTSGDLKAFIKEKRELEEKYFPKIKIKFP